MAVKSNTRKTKQYGFTLPPDIHAELKKIAARNRRSASAQIAYWVQEDGAIRAGQGDKAKE